MSPTIWYGPRGIQQGEPECIGSEIIREYEAKRPAPCPVELQMISEYRPFQAGHICVRRYWRSVLVDSESCLSDAMDSAQASRATTAILRVDGIEWRWDKA